MHSNASDETITVLKSELETLVREVVRQVLRDELQSWRRVRTGTIQSAPDRYTTRLNTLGDLLESEFFGMWRERDDLPDSPEFARTLRAKAWDRSR